MGESFGDNVRCMDMTASATRSASSEVPFFSVITVVFNDLAGLKASRQSLRSQSCGDWEWIVVDGASSDGTAEYVGEVSGECAWAVSECDAGIYDAMNKAARHARGHYLLFLNAGDLLVSTTTLAGVKAAIIRGETSWADMVFGATLQAFSRRSRVLRRPRSVDFLWHGLPAFHQSVLLRREACSQPLYDVRYRLHSDYELIARLHKRGATWQMIDQPISIFFVGGRSYLRRLQTLAESWRIQRDVLGSPLWLRAISFYRGIVAYGVSVVLVHGAAGLEHVISRRSRREEAKSNGDMSR